MKWNKYWEYIEREMIGIAVMYEELYFMLSMLKKRYARYNKTMDDRAGQ